MRIRSSKKRRVFFRIKKRFILIGFIIVIAIYLWATAVTTNPENALSSARKILGTDSINQTEDAAKLLDIAEQNYHLLPWSRLYKAELLEKKGELANAFKAYAEVPELTAASLDARVALLRLAKYMDTPQSEEQVGLLYSKLEIELRENKRHELIAELSLLKALTAEEKHGLTEAFRHFTDIRTNYPKSKAASSAKQATKRLMDGGLIETLSVAELIKHGELMVKENNPADALSLVENIKQRTGDQSPARLQVMLLEESILRAMKRNEEADHILLVVSADGDLGTADQALFKIAKNFWNINDHHRALEMLGNLKNRFPSSPYLYEAEYIHGRILEELNEFTEALDVYRSLASASKKNEISTRALKRIAWLYVFTDDFVGAAKAFSNLADRAASLISNSRASEQGTVFSNAELTRLHDTYAHALFWHDFSLREIDHAPKQESALAKSERKPMHWEKLLMRYPLSYYALLIPKDAQMSREKSRVDLASLFPANLLNGNLPEDHYCVESIPSQVEEKLALLRNAYLRDLAEYEIRWYFYKKDLELPSTVKIDSDPEGSITDAENLSEQVETELPPSLKREISVGRLLSLYGNTNEGIGILEAVIKKHTKEDKIAALRMCLSRIIEYSYPVSNLEVFKQEAATNQVSLSLLLAITRTESHFDPFAISTAGALGLMQLMPSTAEKEGNKNKEDLFNPELNIRFGSRHISRLLKEYSNNLPSTIAAYNAGSFAVNRWRARYPKLSDYAWIEHIGYPETQNYVKKVLLATQIYEARLGPIK